MRARRTFHHSYGFAGVALIFLAPVLVITGCTIAPPSVRDTAKLVRVGEDEAKGLDPQSISDLASLRIAADQFEGLTRFDARGHAEAGLASSWQASSDGLKWQFTLRRGLRFSDGVPITPATFVSVYERLRAPATASPVAELFEALSAVKARGNAVIVTLNHPLPALPELMAHPAISALPLHRAGWVNERPMITSGAYRLQNWALADHIDLVTNPSWHDGKPAIAHIEWRPVTDILAAMRLFQAGAADTVGDIPSARLASLKAKHPAAVHIAPFLGSYYFAFNTRHAPFDDVRVRRALSMAVERDWIANSLIATGVQPAWGIIPPGTSGLTPYRPDWSRWPRVRRLAAAKALLAKAGYGPTRALIFDIRFNSDIDHRRISVALAAFWKPLNVEARLLNSEASLHFASLRRADFALARSGWIGDLSVPENFLAVHRSNGGPINYSGFANVGYDAALDKALLLADPIARAGAMRAAEAMLVEESPILPLYYYVSKSLVSPRVAGWQDNAANIHPSRTLRIVAR